ncbi:WbqC family protein [Mongoliitalea daihaiensis]|uniref:WbqC family protein n=1 Tax=Mongoliitalea daihaiensis TaxID=2782006 RepID=UPI001F42004D|nr:WbqC family protein [Mongoliitalea daihaiensis]UJP63659.1 WbqC family protein [Mongoliitalea daihaiensis]
MSGEKKSAFIDVSYLPPLEYFSAILDCSDLLIDEHAIFQKQSAFNRTTILLSNKVELLSIPVFGSRKRQLYRDVKIDYSQKWMQVHLRGIQSAYGKAPFFEFFFPDLENEFLKKPAFLWDFNWGLLTLCLQLAQINISIKKNIVYSQEEDLEDLRFLTRDKAVFSTRNYYQPHSYSQLFGADFVPNLSIIDLLFCEGPSTKRILELSRKKTLNNQ